MEARNRQSADAIVGAILICMGVGAPILAYKIDGGLTPFFLFTAVFLGPMAIGTGVCTPLKNPLFGAVVGPLVGMLGYFIFFTYIFRVY